MSLLSTLLTGGQGLIQKRAQKNLLRPDLKKIILLHPWRHPDVNYFLDERLYGFLQLLDLYTLYF